MKASRVVSLKKLGIFNYFLKNRIILILCVSFIIGITIGVFAFTNSDLSKQLANWVFTNLFPNRESKTFITLFISSMMLYALFLIVCFLCGTSLMGVVVVPLFVIFCGFLYGDLSAFLYSRFALKGIAFNAVILLPPTLIFFICLTFAAKESVDFSLRLAKTTLPKSRPINLAYDFKNYCGRYLLLASVVLFSSLTDALLSKMFLHHFNF